MRKIAVVLIVLAGVCLLTLPSIYYRCDVQFGTYRTNYKPEDLEKARQYMEHIQRENPPASTNPVWW
jgi:hypothetical protein